MYIYNKNLTYYRQNKILKQHVDYTLIKKLRRIDPTTT
jgi:hypothetical protein